MAFSAKPSAAEIATSGSFTTTVKAFLACNETAGPPREMVSNTMSWFTSALSTARQTSWAADDPSWTTNGFPYATGGADKTLRFWAYGRGITTPVGTGWASATSPTTRTICVTFKITRPPLNQNERIYFVNVGTSSTDVTLLLNGVNLGSGLAGNAYTVGLYRNGSFESPATALVVFPDVWYTLAVSQDDNGGAGNIIRNWWLYDWDAAATYTSTQTGLATTWSVSAPSFGIGMGNTNGSFSPGFDGHLYCALLDSQSWTSANGLFASYVADPLAPMRGAYTSSSGTLAAGTAWQGRLTTTTVELGATRPTLGITPYTYSWERSATAAFTFGTGTVVSSARMFTDTPPGPGPWFYKCKATDSAGTPASVIQAVPFDTGKSQIPVSLNDSSTTALLLLGDLAVGNLADGELVQVSQMRGGPVRGYNMGGLMSISPHVYYFNTVGSPSGGTYTLSWNGNTTSALAYNASTSAIQTALSALPGLNGNVAISSGVIPATITLSGTAATASSPAITVDPSGITGGSQASAYVRCQTRLGADLLLAAGGSLATIMTGTVETTTLSATQYNALVTSAVQYLNGRGIQVLLHQPCITSNTNEGQVETTRQYCVQLQSIVSSVGNPALCAIGDSRNFAMSMRYWNKQMFDSNLQYPQAAMYGAILVDLHGQAVARVTGVQVGAGGGSFKVGSSMIGG